MKTVKKISISVIALLLWTAIVNFGTSNGLLLQSLPSENTAKSFIKAAQSMVKNEQVGNLAMALIEDGEFSEDFYYSMGEPVDRRTIFQMASISKWVTAWGIFALVEEGKLDLDHPVENYLTRWHLPRSKFDNNSVSIRNLLSHRSGLIDGLGYAGFSSEDSIQTIEESLSKAADAYWTEGVTKVGFKPNSAYKYSGGGYTLLQLVIEEVSGKSFNDYMTEAVFKPLGMTNSSFYWSDTSSLQLATFYNADLTIAPHFRYTALAAASLYTNIEDLSLFLKANVSQNKVLKTETISMMVESGLNRHGLGPMIFGKKGNRDLIIGHDGISRAAINNAARINLKSKDGIIIFETGKPSLASDLANEWNFWKTRIPNNTVFRSNQTWLVSVLVAGYVCIVFAFVFYFRKAKKRAATK
jgi:CubicO group peptidase (beta-lactamase class C family)